MIVGACLALALVGGCKKESKKAGGAAPPSSALKQSLAMLPATADAVVGVDLAKLRASELFKTYQKDLEGAASRELRAVRDLCGFDPVAKLSSIVLTGSGSGENADLTAVIKGLDKGETLACLAKAQASPPENTEITVEGDYARVVTFMTPLDAPPVEEPPAAAPLPVADTTDGGVAAADAGAAAPPPAPPAPPARVQRDSVSLQFADDTTAVVARRGGKGADKATLQGLISGKVGDAANLTGAATMMGLVDLVDSNAPVWFAVNGKADSVKEMGGGFLSFDAAYGSVNVTSGIEANLGLRLESPDAASRFASMADKQIQQMRKSLMKDMIGEAKVEAKGADVRLHLVESREQLQKLAEFAQQMAGNLFGQ